ncbi:hypothetical protein SO802_034741 [Lithocarpus litseifolius]|uniref:Helicase C-terminal domain-containing protein n=1 Tax=Lithocarpus litseifolius TaxID=425828 RepID=A0AAW2BGR9_9ROSI
MQRTKASYRINKSYIKLQSRKLKDSTTTGVLPGDSEPPQNPENKIKKKKNKNKQGNKDKAEDPEANNPKRKHEEIEPKEKKSKNKKPKEDDKESKTHQGKEEDEAVKDGLVVVSGHNVKLANATWPLLVHQLAQEFMDPNPVKSYMGSRLLTGLAKWDRGPKGWNVVSIHGDKAQHHERTKALSLFKKGSCRLMIATDVAARGLDIPDVEVVTYYSFPLTTEDYVHRIGRTGRPGKKVLAHTFFMQQNKESQLYGAHFKEISLDAPKAKKITFDDSDDDD